MNDVIKVSDLKKIIHNLILFIVVDTKKYIAEDKLNEYVIHYTKCFIEVMNNATTASKDDHMIIDVMKVIEKDIRDSI